MKYLIFGIITVVVIVIIVVLLSLDNNVGKIGRYKKEGWFDK